MLTRFVRNTALRVPKRQTGAIMVLSTRATEKLNLKPISEGKRELSTAAAAEESSLTASHVGKRYKLTAEVILSKVFWAGFGWQGSSIIAGNAGYAAESAAFALTTGGGEALAVFAGHSLFYSVLMGKSAKQEMSTALWLGTGTFFSGTAWQPVVNGLVALTDNNFPLTAMGTMALCGSAFYAGLRVGRAVWGETFGAAIAARDYDNLNSDAGLSVAIGGATAMFVACDPSMVSNYFATPFGVLESDSDLMGMLRAGAATGTGYGLVQAWQNLFPKGRNWMDIYL